MSQFPIKFIEWQTFLLWRIIILGAVDYKHGVLTGRGGIRPRLSLALKSTANALLRIHFHIESRSSARFRLKMQRFFFALSFPVSDAKRVEP
jgi:hypothetical protein